MCVHVRVYAVNVYIYNVYLHMCVYIYMGFHGGSVIKNLPANAGDAGSGRIFLGRKDPLKKELETHVFFFSLENPMDGGAWWATVHRVIKEKDTT